MNNQPDPEKLLGPNDVLAAQDEGRQAALNGAHPRSCPYADAEYPADVARRKMWNRGYASGRTELRNTQ